MSGHTGSVETIACMRAHSIKTETDMIITGSSDGTIRVWERRVIDDNSGQKIKEKYVHNIHVCGDLKIIIDDILGTTTFDPPDL